MERWRGPFRQGLGRWALLRSSMRLGEFQEECGEAEELTLLIRRSRVP